MEPYVWTALLVAMTTLVTSVFSCPNVCNCVGNEVVCKISNQATFPDNIPATVTSLTIDTTSPVDQNMFGELLPTNFSSFQQLNKIILTRCGITGISTGTFADLPKLKSLTLTANKLVALYPGSFIFAPGVSLTNLTLSSNGLKSLHDYTFRGVDVEVLDLSENIIETIGERTFFEASVETLLLNNNKLTSLGGATFHPLAGSLVALDLSRNGMKSLAAGLLTSLTGLSDVNLSQNEIREVPPGMLNKLTNLKRLELHHNKLTGLKDGEFLDIIDRVDAINVADNPFNCNCELKWMKTFAHSNQTCSEAKKCFTSVRCASPKDVLLKDFPADDFKCSAVKVVDSVVRVSEATCVATGDPAPTIWWKAPSGAVVPAAKISYDGATSTVSTIKITLESEIGTYQCIAGNSLGNVTAPVRDVGTCRSRNVCYGPGDMAGAVLGTFCFCVIAATLLWLFRHKMCKKNEGRKKPVPRFKNNVYRDITSPVGKNGRSGRGELERM